MFIVIYFPVSNFRHVVQTHVLLRWYLKIEVYVGSDKIALIRMSQ